MDFIDNFEKKYDYNCDYMRRMASSAPESFEAYLDFLPMGQLGKSLPKDILWTAKLAAIHTEDCGSCVQLGIKMAIEAQVDKELVKKVISTPEFLNKDHRLIYDFAVAVAKNNVHHYDLYQELEKEYTQEQIIDLALLIASTKVYPTLKRGLGEFKSCSLYSFEF